MLYNKTKSINKKLFYATLFRQVFFHIYSVRIPASIKSPHTMKYIFPFLIEVTEIHRVHLSNEYSQS
jgi:hypothetical protein